MKRLTQGDGIGKEEPRSVALVVLLCSCYLLQYSIALHCEGTNIFILSTSELSPFHLLSITPFSSPFFPQVYF